MQSRLLSPLLSAALLLAVEGLATSAEAQNANSFKSSKGVRISTSNKQRGSMTRSRSTTSGARNDYTWNGDPGVRVSRIRIDISQQHIYAYDSGGGLVGKSPVSTGKAGYSTPTGNFRVTSKSANHRSNLYGQIVSGSGRVIDADASSYQKKPSGSYFVGAPMPYFMRMTDGGVGMHAGFVTGRPASHGCIRLPNGFAAKLFAATRTGTPVEVVN